MQLSFASAPNLHTTLLVDAVRFEILWILSLRMWSVNPSRVIFGIVQKLAQRLRAALPKRRSAHYIPVLREVLTGRYNQFGCGFHSIARDLFESA